MSILFIFPNKLSTQITTLNQAVAEATEGSCGENVTWAFDSNSGLLTISGSGAMTDYDGQSRPPYYNYYFEITEVKIESGVTYIGNCAFAYFDGVELQNSRIEKITFSSGSNLISIGMYAFYRCVTYSFDSSITIPDGVTSIGDWAFTGCEGLTSVTIGSGVTSIGDCAFNGCSGLTSITVASGNATYNSRNDCNAIIETASNTLIIGCKKTIIPRDVTSIGGSAFKGCSGLTSITIPDSVTSIGGYAFNNCSDLTSVKIGSGVTNIGNYAFDGCSGLTSITIPDSVTSIGDCAFYKCSGLTSVTIGSGVTSIGGSAFYRCTDLTSIIIPDSVTSIGGSAFDECSGLTSVTIGSGVTSIGDCAFNGCSGLTSITVASGNATYNSRNDCNAIIETASNTLIIGGEKTIIPSGVTSIEKHAFNYRSGLTSITIPDSVISIGYGAFNGCSGLTSVTIGSGVTSIGGYAFYRCTDLTSIIIPDSVTSIDEYAFCRCSGLTSITIPDSVISVGKNAFYDCSKLTIIGSGDTTKTAYTYAKSNSIDYATAWVKKDSSTHTRTFYAFKTNSGATAVTQTENHNFGDDDICSVCGALNLFTITINVTTNVPRDFVIYILDSSNQSTRQFVVTNGSKIEFAVTNSSTFTVQIYETLYMIATIDGARALKKTFTSVGSDKTITINISGDTNVNNWVII